jgi:hypothetical protein
VLLALGGLAGCGGGSAPTTISTSDAAKLHGDVQRIRSAAAARNPQLAHAALDSLRSDVARLSSRGELASPDAKLMMTEAGQVDSRISAEVKPVAAAPATPQPSDTAQSAPPAPAAPGKGKDKGNGNGNGHGGGGGDGGD